MSGKLLASCLALLCVVHAALAVRAPAIAGIEPLDEQSALLRWDVVDASLKTMRVLAAENSWSSARFLQDECPAARGWLVVHGLEPRRHYRLQLAADSAAPGAVFDYTHRTPFVPWVFIPPGEFVMGDSLDTEAMRHTVQLSGFLISATEITNRVYREVAAAESLALPEDPGFPLLKEYVHRYPEFPVANILWQDAVDFCNGLSKHLHLPAAYGPGNSVMAGTGTRLPTEAEWEYAAAQTPGPYPWGGAPPSPTLANYARPGNDSIPEQSGPRMVRSFPSSSNGLCDMAGNVWEWCNDWYGPFDSTPQVVTNPLGPVQGMYKVLRGGSWADSAGALRTGSRGKLSPSAALSTVGFRVARSFPVTSPQVIHASYGEEHNALAK